MDVPADALDPLHDLQEIQADTEILYVGLRDRQVLVTGSAEVQHRFVKQIWQDRPVEIVGGKQAFPLTVSFDYTGEEFTCSLPDGSCTTQEFQVKDGERIYDCKAALECKAIRFPGSRYILGIYLTVSGPVTVVYTYHIQAFLLPAEGKRVIGVARKPGQEQVQLVVYALPEHPR